MYKIQNFFASYLRWVLAIFIIITIFLQGSLGQSGPGPNWDPRGDWKWNYYYQGNTYVHKMVIDYFNPETGKFSGYGRILVSPLTGLLYDWVVSGIVKGDNIKFRIDYLEEGAGYYVDAEGVISSPTYMSGNARAPPQIATWDAVNEGPTVTDQVDGSIKITKIEYPSEVLSNGAKGDLTIYWSGLPVFPVKIIYRPKSCSSGGVCTAPSMTFDNSQNPLVFPEAVWCSNAKDVYFDYEVVMIDARGTESAPYPAPFTCK